MTDNGDGTLPIVFFGTGFFMAYDSDILGSTGTNDDFCDAAVSALT